MRQVPQYLLIGNGRVARHFRYYFSQLHLPFQTWERQESREKLQEQLKTATHVLLLISDHAIEEFLTQHINQAIWIHVSGSHSSERAYGAHPLTTFNQSFYEIEDYQKIPFIMDHDCPEFDVLLPGLPNPSVRLNKSLKAKYHALCVMSGNFSCLLWQKLFTSFEQEFQFSPEVAFPYLLQQTKNLIADGKNALTGPLVRKDYQTIEKNISALEKDPFQELYKSFVACYQQLSEENNA
jgi:hypothetical protein